MKKSEQAILALALEYPETADVMVSECSSEFFEDDRNRLIFNEIISLRETEHASWFVLFDVLGTRIPPSYWVEIQSTLRGIAPEMAEAVMLEAISRIKKERGRAAAIRQVERVAKEPVISDEAVAALEETVSQMRVSPSSNEDGDLMKAAATYLDFCRQGTTGVITGIPKIDAKIDCLFFGELAVIMGRSWTGKTFFALNILDHIAGKGLNVGFFSLEMPRHLIYERMAQLYFDLSRLDVKEHYGELHHEGFIERYYPGVKVYEKIYSVPELRAVILRHQLRVVFIDYLGLLKSSTRGSSYEVATSIVREIKQLAKDLKIVVVLLVQLSRLAGEGELPVTLNMARDSGAIEEMSDIVIGIWRKGRAQDAAVESDRYITARLLKNKRGEGATAQCYADPRSGRIREIDFRTEKEGGNV